MGLRSDDPDLLRAVLPHIPPGSQPLASETVDHLYSLYVNRATVRRGTRSFALLYFGAERLARSLDVNEVLRALGTHLHRLVAGMTSTAVFVEEADVLVREGRATLLVGGDADGRNQVREAWAAAGATTYSTGAAVFDLGGRARPDASGLPSAVTAVLVGDSGPCRALSPGHALLALLARAPAASVHPQTVLAVLRRVVCDATRLGGDWRSTEFLASDLSARWQAMPHSAKELTP